MGMSTAVAERHASPGTESMSSGCSASSFHSSASLAAIASNNRLIAASSRTTIPTQNRCEMTPPLSDQALLQTRGSSCPQHQPFQMEQAVLNCPTQMGNRHECKLYLSQLQQLAHPQSFHGRGEIDDKFGA